MGRCGLGRRGLKAKSERKSPFPQPKHALMILVQERALIGPRHEAGPERQETLERNWCSTRASPAEPEYLQVPHPALFRHDRPLPDMVEATDPVGHTRSGFGLILSRKTCRS